MTCSNSKTGCPLIEQRMPAGRWRWPEKWAPFAFDICALLWDGAQGNGVCLPETGKPLELFSVLITPAAAIGRAALSCQHATKLVWAVSPATPLLISASFPEFRRVRCSRTRLYPSIFLAPLSERGEIP
jgi:hypothetical protein